MFEGVGNSQTGLFENFLPRNGPIFPIFDAGYDFKHPAFLPVSGIDGIPELLHKDDLSRFLCIWQYTDGVSSLEIDASHLGAHAPIELFVGESGLFHSKQNLPAWELELVGNPYLLDVYVHRHFLTDGSRSVERGTARTADDAVYRAEATGPRRRTYLPCGRFLPL
jgi:hypothetical protein